MNKFLKTPLLTLGLFAVLGVSAFAFGALSVYVEQTGSVAAHDGEDHGDVVAQEASNESAQNNESNEQVEGSYSFVAQPGDSYTKMARKAVQIYGIENSVNLSGAQIIFAETRLTKNAGEPAVDVGQEINLEKQAVKDAVEAAQALDEATVALWEEYVPFVEFNTDAVGEER